MATWVDEMLKPAPRRCESPENVCGRGPVEPVLVTDRRAIHQSDGYKPTWIFACTCGWRRWELARP
jgi:hypothetical protein